jgi:aspartate oxidase
MTISHEPTWIGAGQKAYRKVKGDVTADVAVIGGGLTGPLTAYLLSKNGKRLAVLEASTLGSGATAYTTAFITQVIDTSLSDKHVRRKKSAAYMAGRRTCNKNNRNDSEKRKDRVRVPTMLRSRLCVERKRL